MNTYSCICFLLRILFRVLFHAHTEGMENIPREGAFIIAANHISFLDAIAVGIFVPRDIHYIAKKSLFKIPLFAWILKACNAFPVRRDRPNLHTMKKALAILETGKGLVIFPEGTRNPSAKLLRRGNPGLGMLASLSKSIVIPALITGTDKALPVGAKWIKLEKIRIRYAKPMLPDKIAANEDKRVSYQNFTDEVMKRIEDLSTQC